METVESAIRYAGEFYDSETGLYYLRARYYDPYIGRFLSEDSYWGEDNNPLSLNRYTYAHNDPIQYLDPSGYAVIKKGAKGDQVVAVQEMLKDLGYNVGKADGKFGSQTEAAIKKFQKDNGLKVDGIVGNQSITALKTLTSVKNTPESEKAWAKEHIAEQKVGDIKSNTIIEPKKNTNKVNNTTNNKVNNTVKATTDTNIVASITVEIKNNTVVITGMDIKDANSKNTEISNQPTPGPAPTSVPEGKKEEVVRPGYTVGPVAGSVPDESLRAQYATDDDYVNKVISQIVLGDYTDDVTLLGTIMQVVSGILGIDGAADLRDLSASVLQWEWTGDHVLQASINVVALLPVIGAVKYVDEVGTVLKNSDEVGDVVKGGANIATSSNYRKLFNKEFPDIPSGWQVHHTLPQKYEDIMKAADINIHDVKYLEAIDPKIHSKITTEWAKWDKSLGHVPTADEINNFVKTIDNKYGKYWFEK